ncbi:adenylyl-sulfate kinase [Methylocystis sp. S23]|jgi:bifunctional enzyme CysN/CysC
MFHAREDLLMQGSKSPPRFLICAAAGDGGSTLVDRVDARRKIASGQAEPCASARTPEFVVSDAPERLMAQGTSIADRVIIVVDSRGLTARARRHAFIVSLFGIRHILLAVNKIDLVDFSERAFERIVADYAAYASGLGFASMSAIPISALHGDNIATRSANTPWYGGSALLDHLGTAGPHHGDVGKPFRFAARPADRPNLEFSGYVASGRVAVGDRVVAAISGRQATVARIVREGGELPFAVAGQAATLVLDEEIDVSGGDLLAEPSARPHVADQFQAHLVWFGDDELIPGRAYLMRTAADSVGATVTTLKYGVAVTSFSREAAKTLRTNAIGVCNLSTRRPIAFDGRAENCATAGFLLIDRLSNATVGAGMIDFPLRRAGNIHWQALTIDKAARAAQKGQAPTVLWFTGLSGSGKSTIANFLEKALHAKGRHTFLLDGDNVRHGLNRDLGFTDADRVENVRRVAEVAKLMSDAGLIVLVSLISPFRSERRMAREMTPDGEFIEIFIDTPIEECARRDPKGLYKRAMSGKIHNFTGVSSPYEPPEAPEIHLQTVGRDPLELAQKIVAYLESRTAS